MVSRVLTAVATTLALATAANAATLSVVADSPTYTIGQTITLTVTGDSEGGTATGIFGRLLFDNPAVAAIATGTPSQTTLLALGSIPWLVGVTGCTAGDCNMFNQVGAFGATPAPASNLLIATVSFQATNLGTTNFNWETDSGTGFALDFFGLTNGAGGSFTVVPEPTTAALLGLGLLGLTFAGRRRN